MSAPFHGSRDPIENEYEPEEADEAFDAWDAWRYLQADMLARGELDPRTDNDMRRFYDCPRITPTEPDEPHVLPSIKTTKKAATVRRGGRRG